MLAELQPLVVLGIGFAVSGLLATGYQALTRKPANFTLLNAGWKPQAIAGVPFLVFAAPFIIMRNTLRARAAERANFTVSMIATVVAGSWSLMSGTVVVMALEKIGLIAA